MTLCAKTKSRTFLLSLCLGILPNLHALNILQATREDFQYKRAMRRLRMASLQKNKVRQIASVAEKSPGVAPHVFTQIPSGGNYTNEVIGGENVEELVLDAKSQIHIHGRVVVRAKRIIVKGIINGDFPVLLSAHSFDAQETFLELEASREIDISGVVFLRHYFKATAQNPEGYDVSLSPPADQYRLRLSAPVVRVSGLVALSQPDLPAIGAKVWVSRADTKDSQVDAQSFSRAESVIFNQKGKSNEN